MEVNLSEIDTLWKASFGDTPRPELYKSTSLDEDGFLPLTDPHEFISDISAMTHQQLYASAQNGQNALKMAQDEYLLLDTLIAQIKGKTNAKNPQNLLDDGIFEDRKESQLYGYKYETSKPALLNHAPDEISEVEKRDVQLFQEPFEQGGFVPTERQYQSMLSKIPKNARNKDIRNLDGWKPVLHNGKKLIPRQQIHHDEYDRSMLSWKGADLDRPQTANSAEAVVTPGKILDKRVTRLDGQKRPLTRDSSEAPSIASALRNGQQSTPNGPKSLFHLQEPEDSPTPKRRKLNSNQAAPMNKFKVRPDAATYTIPPEPMPLEKLLAHKWKSEELVAYVKYDHSWLSPNPEKALKIKEALLLAENPVRSWSMHRTWGAWKKSGKDKRPRNKEVTDGTKSRNKKPELPATKESGPDTPRSQQSQRNSAPPVTPLTNEIKEEAKLATVEAKGEVEQKVQEMEPALPNSSAQQPLAPPDEWDAVTSSPERRKSTDNGKVRGASNPVTPIRRSTRTTQKGNT